MNFAITHGPTKYKVNRKNGPGYYCSICSKRSVKLMERMGDKWQNPFFKIMPERINENYIAVGVQPTMNQIVIVYLPIN